MLFNFGPKKNSKPKSQYNNSHFLKPEIHDNFSKDPDLALIFLDLLQHDIASPMERAGEKQYADLFTQTLKKLGLKKNLIIFTQEFLQTHKTSKHLSYQQAQIIAMTERTGGFLLRSSAGETYAAQRVLLILDLPNTLNLDSVSLSQNHNLLLQNLSTQGYLIPQQQQTGIQTGIKRSEIGASLSEHPRVSEKLFIWDASNTPDPSAFLSHAFN